MGTVLRFRFFGKILNTSVTIFQEHLNFYGRDDKHGPIIMSIKVETGQYRVIIRCLDGNFERYFGINDIGKLF